MTEKQIDRQLARRDMDHFQQMARITCPAEVEARAWKELHDACGEWLALLESHMQTRETKRLRKAYDACTLYIEVTR